MSLRKERVLIEDLLYLMEESKNLKDYSKLRNNFYNILSSFEKNKVNEFFEVDGYEKLKTSKKQGL